VKLDLNSSGRFSRLKSSAAKRPWYAILWVQKATWIRVEGARERALLIRDRQAQASHYERGGAQAFHVRSPFEFLCLAKSH